MDLLVNEIVERFYTLLWPMIRVSAFLLAAPFFLDKRRDCAYSCVVGSTVDSNGLPAYGVADY